VAKARGTPRRGKPASYTGRIMVDAVRGVVRVRKWPRKRGKITNAVNLFWMDWFKQANLLAKYVDAASARRAIQMTIGTPLYPRDVLLAAMRGRLYSWADEDGWKWYSVAAIGDVTESLDILAQSIGSVLVRAKDRWRAPPPGSVGDVLTYAGPADPPTWSPASGGGSPPACLVTKSAVQSIPASTVTAITWNTERYDDLAIHDNVVNNTRFTAPADCTRMRLEAQVWFDTNAGSWLQMEWNMNGGTGSVLPNLRRPGASGTLSTYHLQTPWMVVVPGDYFELKVFKNGGGNQNMREDPKSWASAECIIT